MAVQTNQSSRPFSGKDSPRLSCAMSPSLLWEGTKPVSWGRAPDEEALLWQQRYECTHV